jgi:hypothetical protein
MHRKLLQDPDNAAMAAQDAAMTQDAAVAPQDAAVAPQGNAAATRPTALTARVNSITLTCTRTCRTDADCPVNPSRRQCVFHTTVGGPAPTQGCCYGYEPAGR